RVFQAVGAAVLIALGLAIITRVFPSGERGKAVGIGGSVVSLGIMAGPILGGFIISAIGWRWIFFINVPVGIIGTLAVLRILRKDDILTRRRFDLPGAAALFVALAALLLALNQGEYLGWTSPALVLILVVFAAALVSFVFIELKSREPIVQLGIFRSRLFSTSMAASIISFLVLFTVTIRMPYYLQDLLLYEPYKVGLILTAMPLAMSSVAPVSGWISDRIGSRLLTTIGLIIVAVTLILMSTLTTTSSWLEVFLRLALLGVGFGVFTSPNTSAIMGSVPKERLGMGSGVVATMRNTGMSLGVGFSGAVLAASCVAIGAAQASSNICIEGMQSLYVISALICAVGVVISFLRGGRLLPERKKA
ncbi:MAG: MFS transporter, partial [Thermoplasmata archaeon]|nr:MFS transporter [Thermoplasmata archaeon]